MQKRTSSLKFDHFRSKIPDFIDRIFQLRFAMEEAHAGTVHATRDGHPPVEAWGLAAAASVEMGYGADGDADSWPLNATKMLTKSSSQ